jgi:parallel beta-helix repeat protein
VATEKRVMKTKRMNLKTGRVVTRLMKCTLDGTQNDDHARGTRLILVVFAFSLVVGQSANAFFTVEGSSSNLRELGTIVSGVISVNTTWTLANSPYWIEGNTTVNSGTTLIIEPGVEVLFNRYYGLYVEGEMIAAGNPGNPIKFDLNLTNPAPGDWSWIRFDTNSKGRVTDARISYAYWGVSIWSSNIVVANLTIHNVSSGIHVIGPASNNTIRDNTILNSLSSGIYISKGSGNQILNNTIGNATRGISYDLSEYGRFEGNSISECDRGFMNALGASNFTLSGNLLQNNNLSIRIWKSNGVTINNNTILDSRYDGILIAASSQANATGNNVSNSGDNGMRMSDSDNVTVISNDILSSILTGVKVINSEDIIVYGNKFLGNGIQGEDDSADRYWNASYPIGGNYWSDYSGIDRFSGPGQDKPGPDGIGDSAYGIDVGVSDRYPLIWSPNLDAQSPEISNVTLNGKTSLNTTLGSFVTIQAMVNDSNTGGTIIKGANYTIGRDSWPGALMWPVDGDWDSPKEQVFETLDTNSVGEGTFEIFVYAEDDNWNTNTSGAFAVLTVTLPDESPPQISSVQAIPNPQMAGENVNISADVYDDYYVETVSVQIEGPAGFSGNSSMNFDATTGKFFLNTSYGDAGFYYYTIWASDKNDNWASSSGSFEVVLPDDIPPTADAGSNQDVERKSEVTFNGSKSLDDVGITYFSWSFIDGIPIQLPGEVATHIFNDVGLFEVTLNVSDSLGNWDIDKVWINVTDSTPPAAPTGLLVHVDEENQSLILQWIPNQEDDIQTYKLYRSGTSGSGYEFIGEVDDSKRAFEDIDIEVGSDYYYVVTAVDTWDNTSPFSNEAFGIISGDGESNTWWLALLAVVILSISILVLVLVLRKRREQDPSDNGFEDLDTQ